MKQEKEKAPKAAATTQSAKGNNIQIQNTGKCPESQDPEIPGCRFVGSIAEETSGKRIPVYEPEQPTNGRPSINTLEGWNLFRRESMERLLQKRTGRKPTNEEIEAELDQQAAEAQRMVAQWEMNQSETLPKLFR